jgi:phosphoglycerate dehydrogenase-like enzyme
VVQQEGLWDVLVERPDLTAILDVVWPEPPAKDSRMWDLPNVVYTPHICGSLGDEVLRMADAMIEELERTLRGEAPLFTIDQHALQVMA